jgi:hypothetical protein
MPEAIRGGGLFQNNMGLPGLSFYSKILNLAIADMMV